MGYSERRSYQVTDISSSCVLSVPRITNVFILAYNERVTCRSTDSALETPKTGRIRCLSICTICYLITFCLEVHLVNWKSWTILRHHNVVTADALSYHMDFTSYASPIARAGAFSSRGIRKEYIVRYGSALPTYPT